MPSTCVSESLAFARVEPMPRRPPRFSPKQSTRPSGFTPQTSLLPIERPGCIGRLAPSEGANVGITLAVPVSAATFGTTADAAASRADDPLPSRPSPAEPQQ